MMEVAGSQTESLRLEGDEPKAFRLVPTQPPVSADGNGSAMTAVEVLAGLEPFAPPSGSAATDEEEWDAAPAPGADDNWLTR